MQQFIQTTSDRFPDLQAKFDQAIASDSQSTLNLIETTVLPMYAFGPQQSAASSASNALGKHPSSFPEFIGLMFQELFAA